MIPSWNITNTIASKDMEERIEIGFEGLNKMKANEDLPETPKTHKWDKLFNGKDK